MKKFLILLGFVLLSVLGLGQCYNTTLYPATTFTPTCTGANETITSAGYATEYSNVNVVAGISYTFSTDIATDFITISNTTNTVAYAWGVTPVTWVSTITGVIRFHNHINAACGTNTSIRYRYVRCGNVYLMNNTAVTTCSGAFNDDGDAANYTTNKDYTKVFTPGTPGLSVKVTFTSWVIGDADDYLIVYDGPNNTFPIIGTFNNITTPTTVTATNGTGQLTFVWHSDNNGAGAGWTSIISCVTTPPPPPANDNCAGSVVLTVNTDLLCGTVTLGTVTSSTNSGIAACVGSGADDDVWYTFVATSTVHNISLLNIAGSSTDMVFEIFSGACGSLASIACSDPNSGQWGGFTIGQTYHIRVYTYTTTGGQNTTFNVCVGTPPPPPSNDEPCGALTLTVNNGSCSYQSAVLQTSSTVSAGIPAPGCGSLGPDIWYKFVVPASGRIIIDMATSGGPTDMDMAWYTSSTNNCNNINQLVDCDDLDSQNGMMAMICHAGASCVVPGDCQQLGMLTPGQTIYVRLWEYGGDAFGPFDICAYDPGAPGAPSNCGNATIIAGLPYSNSGQTTCCRDNTYNSTTGCLSAYQDGEDVLYSYTPAANQTVDVTLTGTLGYTGVFITDKCPNAGGVNCIGSATSITGNPTLCGVSLNGGTTYYIMVDTDPTPNCTPFNINVTSSSTPTCGLNYAISNIGFAPDLNAGTNIALPIDDRFSSSYVPIGFNFCFDGYQFTQLLVSSNGYLIFDPIGCASNLPTGNAAPGAYSAYSISAAIPNTTNAPRNCIMFPWQDIDPSLGGTIKYQVLGISPNRRFVITYDQIPYYSCTSIMFTGQVKLFETTNNIEIHIGSKVVCATWNGGDAILGLHNFNGTVAKVPAGTNYPTNWTAANQSWRFTYNCAGPCIVPLPITLVDFKVKCEDKQRVISWSTASEENSDYFIIQNSEDGISFTDISTIKAAGNSNILLNYTYNDYEYYGDKTIYYRLLEYDFDGAKQEFDVYASSCRNNEDFVIYPNPSKSGEEIFVLGSIESVSVYDIIGKEMNFTFKNNILSGLPAGVFIIKINNNFISKIVIK